MSCSYDYHTCIAQPFCITPLLTIRNSITYVSKILMTVSAYELMIRFAIKPESILTSKLCITYTKFQSAAILSNIRMGYSDFSSIQIRRLGTPQIWFIYFCMKYRRYLTFCRNIYLLLYRLYYFALHIFYHDNNIGYGYFVQLITHFNIKKHICIFL